MKLTKYIAIISLSGILSSCNGLLDIDESTRVPEETIFQFMDRVTQALTNAYTYLPSDFHGVSGTMRSCATDDAEYAWNTSAIRYMNDGSWSSKNTVDSNWGNYYTAIRSTNFFLENFTLDLLKVYQYQSVYNDYLIQLTNYQYEARFLRAFFHFELAKRYGDIPLAKKVFTTEEANSLDKTPFYDVIEYIVDECDAIADKLPVNYNNMPGKQTGRVTKGAVMALKARALLYAASKLHNPTNDTERWKRAAKASLALIDSAEIRSWYKLPGGAYDTNVAASTELILETREIKTNYFESENYPVGIDGGSTGVCPSQNLVDAFEMKNGTAFDWNNPAHAKAPYTGRDPRLAKTILQDGATFKGTTIDIAYGGLNAAPKEGATKTGYYIFKFLVTSVQFTPTTTTADHYWPLFRYAEVLLNYAEAMNEAFPGSTTYTDATFTRTAQWALNKVRARATLLNVTGLNYADFQTKVRNERRVELAFEDHRFWDIRRWMIGSDVTIYGTEAVVKDGVRTYAPNKVVSVRKWNDRMYLYPIPASEYYINPKLGQNTGW